MSTLTNTEKRSIERFLGMGTGYVLDFSNRTFEEFIADSTGRSIYDAHYESGSGSKANRLRAFWSVENDDLVGKLLTDLMTYAVERGLDGSDKPLLAVCTAAAERLSKGNPVLEIESITVDSAEKVFVALARAVREAIEKNEAETGLDRLHTFVVKYMRLLCEKRGITTERDKPLHSLVGEYVRRLKEGGELETDMTERILKSSISTLEAFNRVRNDNSFAHDNPILNYDESLLIFNHVTSSIRFIEALERRKGSVARSKEPDGTPAGDVKPGAI